MTEKMVDPNIETKINIRGFLLEKKFTETSNGKYTNSKYDYYENDKLYILCPKDIAEANMKEFIFPIGIKIKNSDFQKVIKLINIYSIKNKIKEKEYKKSIIESGIKGENMKYVELDSGDPKNKILMGNLYLLENFSNPIDFDTISKDLETNPQDSDPSLQSLS